MHQDAVALVRRFNRTVTQRVGALDDAYLARGRPLGQARVLWEVGANGRQVRALRAVLGLDSGHLSRLLRVLQADGLVEIAPDPKDGRVRIARLTQAGLAERAELDERSDQLATAMLAPLSDRQRRRLIEAMQVVERLLGASMVEIAAVDPRDPRARACIRAYFAELDERFEHGFDPSRSIPAEGSTLRAPAGLLLLATLHGDPLGCGALAYHDDRPAELKRMWVSPAARGLGLGRRLLGELEARAWAEGVGTLRLETNGVLVEAIELYRAAGYREVAAFNDEPYADHWFEKSAPVEPQGA